MKKNTLDKKLPNFFIIGAAKCGTTSLFHYLSQHPDIYFPTTVKESNYFVFCNREYDTNGPGSPKEIFNYLYGRSINNFTEYKSLFKSVKDEMVIGEVCPRYLYYDNASKNLKEFNPEAKIIVILRNPVERAFSHYKMLASRSLAPYNFYRELQEEDQRISQGWGWDWHYCALGRYFEQIERYYQLFSRKNIKIILYEDFFNDSTSALKDICSFLNITAEFDFDLNSRHMVSYNPKNKFVHQILKADSLALLRRSIKKLFPAHLLSDISKRLKSFNESKKTVDNKSAQYILSKLKQDMDDLELLLGRDLSHWRQGY